MTIREAAIVSAYSGFLLGKFSDLHKYIEEIMERPVWTHELGIKKLTKEIKQKAKKDFCNLEVS